MKTVLVIIWLVVSIPLKKQSVWMIIPMEKKCSTPTKYINGNIPYTTICKNHNHICINQLQVPIGSSTSPSNNYWRPGPCGRPRAASGAWAAARHSMGRSALRVKMGRNMYHSWLEFGHPSYLYLYLSIFICLFIHVHLFIHLLNYLFIIYIYKYFDMTYKMSLAHCLTWISLFYLGGGRYNQCKLLMSCNLHAKWDKHHHRTTFWMPCQTKSSLAG